MRITANKRALTYGLAAIVLFGYVFLGMEEGIWQSLGVAAIALALGGIEQFVHRRRAGKDQRLRTQLSREDHDCKRCGADLWGLDVKPGKGRDYVVKCGECGAVNSIAKPKKRKAEKRAGQKVELEDRGPFKIR